MWTQVWIKEKSSFSVIYAKKRLRGYEAGGLHRLDRVTAWPQAHCEASDSVVTQEMPVALSVHLSRWPNLAPMKTTTCSLPCTSFDFQCFHPPVTLIFSQFPMWLPLPARLSLLLWPYLFCPLFPSLCFFPHPPLWFHSSDPLNRFTLSILKVCLFPMISQSLTHSFCSALYSLIWFTRAPLFFLALLSPIPFPLQNHPWYLFDCHQPEERWKSILLPATASLWLRREGRQLAGL